MNDIMSFGLHRFAKKKLVGMSGITSNQTIMDLAGGTGDISLLFSKVFEESARVYLVDINNNMMQIAQERFAKSSSASEVRIIKAFAEQLPFSANSVDCVAISFGIRNFTDKGAALQSVHRILKPGGKIIMCDFSNPQTTFVRSLNKLYFNQIVPFLSKILIGDFMNYKYLAESISVHPDQKQLKVMMEMAGFKNCRYENLFNGIIALHEGIK